MRSVLERCLGGELRGESDEELKSIGLTTEWELEIVRRTMILMEEHAESDSSTLSIPKRLASVYDLSLLDTFKVLQQFVDAARPPGEPSAPFCLHNLTAESFAPGPAVEEYARKQDEGVSQVANISQERVRAELIAASASGRAVGLEEAVLVGAGVRLSHLASNVLVSTLGQRIDTIIRTRYIGFMQDPRVPYELLYNFNKLSNESSFFLASAMHQSHLSHLPDVPPSPHIPPANSRLPPPLSLSLPFDLLNPSVDLYPELLFSPRSYVVPPRFCPVDKCSGRPPIEENFEVVEKLLVALFSWILQEELLVKVTHDEVRSIVVLAVLQLAQSMDVGTEEEQERYRQCLPRALVMTRVVIRQFKTQESASLMPQLGRFRMLLVKPFPSSSVIRRLLTRIRSAEDQRLSTPSMRLRFDALCRWVDERCRVRQNRIRHRSRYSAGTAHASDSRNQRVAPKNPRVEGSPV